MNGVGQKWGEFSNWLSEQGDAVLGEGFVAGFATALILVLLVLLVRWKRRRKRQRGITLSSDTGDVFIATSAIREFVARILGEFGDAALEKLSVREQRTEIVLNVKVSTLPDTRIPDFTRRVKERIITEAGDRLGIEEPIRVNIDVPGMSADARTIARQNRKAGGRAEGRHEKHADGDEISS